MRKRSLAFKLVWTVMILTFPINIFLTYYAKQSQDVIVKDVKMNISSMADIYINEIDNNIRSINTFIMNLEESDANLLDILDSQDWDKYFISALGLRETMNAQMTVRRDANCYFFYDNRMEHGMLVENSAQFTQKELTDYCFGEDLKHMFSKKEWQIVSIYDTTWLFHIYKYKPLYLGTGIQLDTFEKQFQETLGYDGVAVHFSKESAPERNPGIEVITRTSEKERFYLHVQIPRESIVRNLPVLMKIGYWMALLELFLIPILIMRISYNVLKPLSVLISAIEELKKNRNARITADANSTEFALVYHSFNRMADEIMQMKFDNYEQKIKQQKISMRNLQLQVKPHFLFNSFNLMYNLVQMGEYKSAQQMILYLSDYFHYINIGNKDFARFGDEFHLIKMYLEVSQIRYPDIFTVRYDVSEEIKDVLIPQMLIHNFVENIIKHGLSLTRKNQILVQAYVSRGEAVFRVEDDGRGMTEEVVMAINDGKFKYPDGKNHLGVKNSFDRIHYFYGDKGHIYFESEVGHGTIVAITLPLEPMQEGVDYESVDCE